MIHTCRPAMGKAETRRSQSLRLSWATELDAVQKKKKKTKTEKKKEKRKKMHKKTYFFQTFALL